jgi:hypothetical protein
MVGKGEFMGGLKDSAEKHHLETCCRNHNVSLIIITVLWYEHWGIGMWWTDGGLVDCGQ